MSRNLSFWWRQALARISRSPAKRRPLRSRSRLSLERLEDRVVLSTWDYTDLVQTLGVSHAGPTHLYLNFDGKDDITPYFNMSQAQTDQDIEEILFRTSEVFAPFNVQVSQLTGKDNYDQSGDGNTTVFIGYDPSNMKNGAKYAYAHTPSQYSDRPGWAKGFDHTPNSDDNDIAYVDPYSDSGIQSVRGIVQGLVHEAGHTFGLAHVRTDMSTTNPNGFLQDPEPLPDYDDDGYKLSGTTTDNQGTADEVMSYTDANFFFADQTFPTTGWNNTGSPPLQLDGVNMIPKWIRVEYIGIGFFITSDDVVTQNSFTYLQQVLGDRPPEAGFSVAHSAYLDPNVLSTYLPSGDTLTPANHLSATGTIGYMGDHDVHQWTAPSDQVLRINVTSPDGLDPVLVVYGFSPTDSANNTVDVLVDPAVQTITAQAGFVYRFAVGGASGNSTGDYKLTLSTLTIEGDADFAGENDIIRLVRDYAQPDLIDVFINNPSSTPNYQVDFSTLTYLAIDGKAGDDTIILDFSNGNLIPIGGIDLVGGSGTDDHLNVIGPVDDTNFTVVPGLLNFDDAKDLVSIPYAAFETLEVMAGNGANSFDILGAGSDTRVRLHGGSGNDDFYVDNNGSQNAAGVVKTIGGELDIDGGPDGKNTLTLNDVSDPVPAQVTVTFNSVGASQPGDNFFGPDGRVYYENLNLLTINMGTSQRERDEGNVVYVLSTATGTTTHINTGQNSDTIYVGGPGNRVIGGDGPLSGPGPQASAGDVSSIRSKLLIDGQDGADKLFVLDNLSVMAKQVTHLVTPPPNFNVGPALGTGLGDTFFGAGGELHYYSVSSLDVNLGAGGNTVNIQQTNADTVTTFHAGAGNDTVTVCSTAPALGGDLAGIGGPLTVDVGGGNANVLFASDRKAAQGNQAVVLAGNLISGFAGPNDDVPINYLGIPQLILHGSNTSALAENFHINDPAAPVTLNANDGKDGISVHASHLPVTIDGGLGDDTIAVSNLGNSLDTILGPVTVGGGPGFDPLQINDQGAVTDKTYNMTPTSVARSGTGTITFNSTIDSLVLKAGSGNDQVNVLGLPNVQLVAVTDSWGNDRLTGPSQLTTWQVLATNAGKLNGQLGFFGFENLTGGAAKDTFTISSGAGLTGKLDGGGGQSDSLEYQPWNQPVSFDLANLKATGLGSFAGIERFVGGSASDTLTGPNAPNFWNIKGTNAGEINTLFFGVLAFESVENLSGGTSSDVFQFALPGQLAGGVNGGGGNGTDQLDYSLMSITMPVRVNLLAGTASRVAGAVAGIKNAAGGSGDDILVGNAVANTLTGNGGRDLIIGGLGSDILSGGAGEDLLIGGNTLYDLNVSALNAIMAEWTSSSDYDLRRKHLLGLVSGGLNGTYTLNNIVVPDDGAADQLTGAADTDWFWSNPIEIAEILQPGEKIGIN